jgi:glucosamine--fructose-6-phosphate aminotransferase (isomerizing)
MCGIVGAVAERNIVPNLVEGLKRLEYRGYDSCGVALYQDRHLLRSRSVDRVATLQEDITHSLGHPRQTRDGKRASAFFAE